MAEEMTPEQKLVAALVAQGADEREVAKLISKYPSAAAAVSKLLGSVAAREKAAAEKERNVADVAGRAKAQITEQRATLEKDISVREGALKARSEELNLQSQNNKDRTAVLDTAEEKLAEDVKAFKARVKEGEEELKRKQAAAEKEIEEKQAALENARLQLEKWRTDAEETLKSRTEALDLREAGLNLKAEELLARQKTIEGREQGLENEVNSKAAASAQEVITREKQVYEDAKRALEAEKVQLVSDRAAFDGEKENVRRGYEAQVAELDAKRASLKEMKLDLERKQADFQAESEEVRADLQRRTQAVEAGEQSLLEAAEELNRIRVMHRDLLSDASAAAGKSADALRTQLELDRDNFDVSSKQLEGPVAVQILEILKGLKRRDRAEGTVAEPQKSTNAS